MSGLLNWSIEVATRGFGSGTMGAEGISTSWQGGRKAQGGRWRRVAMHWF